jgi:hypothetical protein
VESLADIKRRSGISLDDGFSVSSGHLTQVS